MAPWWMILQGAAVVLVLGLAGYAWHDRLGGRLPRAGRWALLALFATGIVLAFLNADAAFAALPFAAAPALGWSLRRAHPAPLPARADVSAGLGYAALAGFVAATWSGTHVVWGFLAGAALVVLRVALVDPLLAWRARRSAALAEVETSQRESING